MQLGFVTAIFGDLSFEEVLKHAAEIGYDCVEVMCWPPGGADRKYGGVTHIDCTDFTQAKADDVRALCEKHGVAISALGYYSNPAVARRRRRPRRRSSTSAQGDRRRGAARAAGDQHVHRRQPARCRWTTTCGGSRKCGPTSSATPRTATCAIGIENCPMLYRTRAGRSAGTSPARRPSGGGCSRSSRRCTSG